MHIEIWHLEGEGRGRADAFESAEVRIGSEPGADVYLPASAGILPLHAAIVIEDGAAWLRPLGTVRLNGNAAGEVHLRDGDLLEIGDDVRLRVRLAPTTTARQDGVRNALSRTKTAGRLPAATGRALRGAPVAGVTALFLAILVAGTFLAARKPSESSLDDELALRDRLRSAQQRAYEARIETLRHSLTDLEARVVTRDAANEKRLGQVKRAVAEVETSVLQRVNHEIERSLDNNKELRAARDAVKRIEDADLAAERIIARFSGSVCVVQGAYGFGKEKDGRFRFLREATPEMLEAMEIGRDKVPLMLEGDGPPFRVEYSGTGFLVDKRGIVLTNRHIAEPWWKNSAAESLLADGYKARFLYLRAYFPGKKKPVSFQLSRTVLSRDADLGALFFAPKGKLPPALELADQRSIAPGRRVLLLGYPSGLDALLARTDENFVHEIGVVDGDPLAILDVLAQRGFVRPLPTQGHIGDVLSDRVMFDAPTAVGGSGGPLLDLTGRVVAINYGILKAFSGANFGVPVAQARTLLIRARATLKPAK